MSSQQETSVICMHALSEGMHALAQPLAIVQGTLEIAAIGATTISDYQKAVEESLAQIERAAELLSYVKELVKVNREQTKGPLVVPGAVFEEVYEDLRCVFDESKVRLEMHCDEALAGSLAERLQMRQALFYMLQAARSYAEAGSAVEMTAGLEGGFVRVSIRNLSLAKGNAATLQTLSISTVARSVALAETIVTRHGGRFSFETDPFSACLWFPAVQSEATESEASRSESEAELVKRTGTE